MACTDGLMWDRICLEFRVRYKKELVPPCWSQGAARRGAEFRWYGLYFYYNKCSLHLLVMTGYSLPLEGTILLLKDGNQDPGNPSPICFFLQ